MPQWLKVGLHDISESDIIDMLLIVVSVVLSGYCICGFFYCIMKLFG